MSHKLPTAFIQSLKNINGFDEEKFINAHEHPKQIVSVRMNPFKKGDLDIKHLIDTQVPWSTNGYYLSERPSFTLDPQFHAGAYYVQEASSMFLEYVMQQICDLSLPLKVLDLCAAPGGKSTLLQSLISHESLLVSNEVIKTRVKILAENITKWGASNVVITNNDPKDFQRLPEFFDVIVVDAPCSGSGLFRKDPTAIEEWSFNNVELCGQRQQRILADVIGALKIGGKLIYSTCSYSPTEDEKMVEWLLENYPMESIQLTHEPSWNIVETTESNGYGYKFFPDKLKGEGFFIACFTKTNNTTTEANTSNKAKFTSASNAEINVAKSYVKKSDSFSFIKLTDDVLALDNLFKEDVLLLQSNLYVKKAGVRMGTVIKNELVPDHELILSNIAELNWPKVEIDKINALNYLRRSDFIFDTNSKGWAIVTYRNYPLGLAKFLPNRVNNYYPKDWRIINK